LRETYLKSSRLLQEHPNIEKYFKKIKCGDESFFGTIFYAASPNHIPHGTTYVRWQVHGEPKVLTIEDLDRERENGHCLYARKTLSREIDLVQHLDQGL
jgi:hypothetical protein